FCCSCARLHRHLPSFPTRRSSDLAAKDDVVATATVQRIGTAAAGDVVGPAIAPQEVAAARSGQRVRALERQEEQASQIVIVDVLDRKSTRLNSSHVKISYAVFCLK